VKLGGGHPNNGLEKYLANDRKVLSFNIMWDDRTLEGQVNFFTLNYFLADDTVEINEVAKQNCGKDPYASLLKRCKLPKKPILTHYPGMTLQKEEFYRPKDFICGLNVDLLSRDCLIYDCDQFTKSWYRENLNIEQEPVSLESAPLKKFEQAIPPYNGYGSEEDSLGSFYSLDPKRPKVDVKKIFANS